MRISISNEPDIPLSNIFSHPPYRYLYASFLKLQEMSQVIDLAKASTKKEIQVNLSDADKLDYFYSVT